MPYDPAIPSFQSFNSSAQMRDQLQALFELASTGRITGVELDAVNTVEPGQPASVAAQIVGTVMHFTFNIPRGANGTDGTDGGPGPAGPQGPPFANALTGGVAREGDLTAAVKVLSVVLGVIAPALILFRSYTACSIQDAGDAAARPAARPDFPNRSRSVTLLSRMGARVRT